VLESLDHQYRALGKPAVWFLPLKEPIAPYLDELLRKPSRVGSLAVIVVFRRSSHDLTSSPTALLVAV